MPENENIISEEQKVSKAVETIAQDENSQSEKTEEPIKKSKAILPYCQFRFGDIAFFMVKPLIINLSLLGISVKKPQLL